MVSQQQMQARDQAIMDEFRKTRDAAIDAVSTRAINLRIDLNAAMAENAEAKRVIERQRLEIDSLKNEMSILEAAMAEREKVLRKRGRVTRG